MEKTFQVIKGLILFLFGCTLFANTTNAGTMLVGMILIIVPILLTYNTLFIEDAKETN